MPSSAVVTGSQELKDDSANPVDTNNVEIVAAVTGKAIEVVSALAQNRGSSLRTVQLKSEATNLGEAHPVAANGGGYSLPLGELVKRTSIGEALNVALDGAGDVVVSVTYREV